MSNIRTHTNGTNLDYIYGLLQYGLWDYKRGKATHYSTPCAFPFIIFIYSRRGNSSPPTLDFTATARQKQIYIFFIGKILTVVNCLGILCFSLYPLLKSIGVALLLRNANEQELWETNFEECEGQGGNVSLRGIVGEDNFFIDADSAHCIS